MEPGAGYLFRVRWSPSRPLVFSVVTADGRLLIYDLKVSVYNYIRVYVKIMYALKVTVVMNVGSNGGSFYP